MIVFCFKNVEILTFFGFGGYGVDDILEFSNLQLSLFLFFLRNVSLNRYFSFFRLAISDLIQILFIGILKNNVIGAVYVSFFLFMPISLHSFHEISLLLCDFIW